LALVVAFEVSAPLEESVIDKGVDVAGAAGAFIAVRFGVVVADELTDAGCEGVRSKVVDDVLTVGLSQQLQIDLRRAAADINEVECNGG